MPPGPASILGPPARGTGLLWGGVILAARSSSVKLSRKRSASNGTDGGDDAGRDEHGTDIRHDEVERQRPGLSDAKQLRSGPERVGKDRDEAEHHEIDDDPDDDPDQDEASLPTASALLFRCSSPSRRTPSRSSRGRPRERSLVVSSSMGPSRTTWPLSARY